MNFLEIPVDNKNIDKKSKDAEIVDLVKSCRSTAEQLMKEDRRMDALERTVEGLKHLREFSDFENVEFRAMLVALLFDLSEIHFELKDYKQSEKELEVLFRILENLIKEDADRFGKYHILAMELSTRILRSRKKTMELLVKQQMNAGQLYEKVNSGVVAATDRLVDSLRNIGELLASTGDYRAAMKFYSEAIKLSKRRAGRVTEKEIGMSVDMAKIMMRMRQMRPRAQRMLEAVLPHAISMNAIELEEDILALQEIIAADIEHQPLWKNFMHKVQLASDKVKKAAETQIKKVASRKKKEDNKEEKK